MPYKFETKHQLIPKEYDRRIKITPEQRKEIKKLYGKISQRKLAKMFNVSRRLVTFIGDPSKLKRHKYLSKLRGSYYEKEKQKKYMKKHRRYKYILYKQGRLKK
jgi:serine/threonine-protein kinase RIO1